MATGTTDASGPSSRTAGRGARLVPWLGLVVVLVLIALAFALPRLLDWEVYSRAPRSASSLEVPPLHGLWRPKPFGPGTVPAILLAVLAVAYAGRLAETLGWRRLLVTSYVGGVAWLVSLASVDGLKGLSRTLGNPYEYLRQARATGDVPAVLADWVARIPLDSPNAFVTHVSGHPPGALLFFVLLDRIGLGGDLAASLVVVALVATTPLAVMTVLRTLAAEDTARRAAPFLVLGPAAVFSAVSADALFGAVAAWGLAALAVAATRTTRRTTVGWSVVAGLLLGWLVMMSYGLPLMGLLALAILWHTRSWLPLVVAGVVALLLVLAFVPFGFAWWEAYPVLHDRYWDGIAKDRPATYWMWANLAALTISGGPILGAGIAQLLARPRHWWNTERPVVLLAAAAACCVLAADLSRMSKGEVERIWLPFYPWLLLTCALLPPRWRRWGLALQVLTALVVQHLFYTAW